VDDPFLKLRADIGNGKREWEADGNLGSRKPERQLQFGFRHAMLHLHWDFSRDQGFGRNKGEALFPNQKMDFIGEYTEKSFNRWHGENENRPQSFIRYSVRDIPNPSPELSRELA